MDPRFLLNIVRRRPVSLACALVFVTGMACIAGADVPVVLLLWVVTSIVALGGWRKMERYLLRAGGCRPLTAREQDSFKLALDGIADELLIVDRADPWIVRGMRSIVIGSGMLDVLDERELHGLLVHASLVDPAAIAGELVVWIGILPLRAAWHVNHWLGALGRLFALFIGVTLVVPLVIWPQGYLRWGGRLLGSMIGGMLGSVMLSSGMAFAGLALMTAWAIVPGVRLLLGWESRRAERAADAAIIQAGFGWELLGAFDVLLWLDPQPVPPGLIGLLRRVGTPIRVRCDRLWRALSQSPEP